MKQKVSILITGLTVMAVVAMAVPAFAASRVEIDAKVAACLKKFYADIPAAEQLSKKAEALLVFPSVIKAGFIAGGEYGEGALLVNGETQGYYSTAAGSIGFQLGAQSKAVILMFMLKDSLDEFRNSTGWSVGVDGSVALIEIGAGGSVDTTNIKDPIIGFVFGQKGLMYNLTLEGAKITEIVR